MKEESNIAPNYNIDLESTGELVLENNLLLEECPCCERKLVVADATDCFICVDCAAEANRQVKGLRASTKEWMETAIACGIELYERQPQETSWEWTVWCAWRDTYPAQKPSCGYVAKKLNTTSSAVKYISSRWNFNVRMEAWMDYCDSLTREQRKQAIVDMNNDHIDMAKRLRAKLSTAIDNIEPEFLKPSDISSLAKLSTELERKARLDNDEQEEKSITRRAGYSVASGSAAELKKATTSQSDLGEVVSILLKSGALDGVLAAHGANKVGIKQQSTTTTEVVVAADDESAASATVVEAEIVDDK